MRPKLRPHYLRSVLLIGLLALFASCKSTQPVDPGIPVQDFEDFDEFDEFEEFDVEEVDEVFDPLSGFNRLMFQFNDKVYVWIWDPVSRGWRFVVPQGVRVAIDRAYKNATTPIRFANGLLQLKFKKAGSELGRFVVNTTVGLLGLFDPADAWLGWGAPSSEDFGQTLGYYGVGEGFPLVIPFLGPSNVRDGIGFLADGAIGTAVYDLTVLEGVAIYAANQVNRTSLNIGVVDVAPSERIS